MSDVKYWLWLQRTLGAGAMFKEILEDFGSVEKLYESNILEMRMSSAITSRQIDRVSECSLDDVERTVDDCKKNGWEIISYDDEAYPQRLREIPNPPAVLFVDGEWIDFDSYTAIGIVGTRKASSYACNVAKVMAKGISLCGGLTVSGGAVGVDTAAHNGSLEVNGKTFAVLGNGFGTRYLNVNSELRSRIKQNGALITEYPPFSEIKKSNFPIRNRIISGLSNGVLVVQAGLKSGSLITAKHAYEQGRDVYTVPASIFDYSFLGTNKLIEDGATVATSPSILLERYENEYETLDLLKAKTVRELNELNLKG